MCLAFKGALRLPALDPPLGGWDYEKQDMLPGYWNEPNEVNGFTNHSTNTLIFVDAPALAGYIAYFNTALAGVRTDGHVVAIGNYYRWKCRSWSSIFRLKNYDDSIITFSEIELLGSYPITDLPDYHISFLEDLGVSIDEPCRCDVDGDLRVNLADFSIIASRWLASECDYSNDWCDGADFEPGISDGLVNGRELLELAENWMRDYRDE